MGATIRNRRGEFMDRYDVIIIGGGPAGCTAGIYACRGGLKTLIIEKKFCGGQTVLTDIIENYPGLDGISGFEFAQKLKAHALKYGAEIVSENVEEIDLEGEVKRVNNYEADAVIIATGAVPKKLGIDREEELTGKGVSYCATCDGMFFKGKDVAVVGGGNTALEDAEYLNRICRKVYLIHRRDKFRGDMHLVKRVEALENVELCMENEVKELVGTPLSSVVLKDGRELSVNGIFIAVGNNPQSELFGACEKENGYILTDEFMRTNIPGVYAVGDVRKKFLRQIITACSDGAVASSHIISNK